MGTIYLCSVPIVIVLGLIISTIGMWKYDWYKKSFGNKVDAESMTMANFFILMLSYMWPIALGGVAVVGFFYGFSKLILKMCPNK